MTTQKKSDPACDLSAFPAAERSAHITEALALRQFMHGYERTAAGLRVIFTADAAPERIAEWARRDRRCCPWIQNVRVFARGDRHILELELEAAAAKVWIDLFLSLPPEAAGTEAAPGAPGFLRRAVMLALGLGFACLMPIAGGVLVARGILPGAWNPGEAVYLLGGGVLLAAYFARRWWRRRKTGEASRCGC